MGSEKSGRWLGSGKKTSVEQCLRLTVSNLRDSGVISGKANDVVYSWKTGEAETDVATVRVRVASHSSTQITVRLAYTVQLDGKSHEVKESVHLAKAAQDNGAKWWIKCPAHVDGVACSRKVGILYLPPGEQFFACKHCHDLAYPWTKKNGETKGGEMSDAKDVQIEDETLGPWNPPGQSGQTTDRPYANEPDPAPPPLRSFFYISHALKLLAKENSTLREEGRVKLVGELLSRMVGDEGLPEERFAMVIPQIQSLAPAAFSAFATRVLSEGRFSIGAEQTEAYFPLHRMGRIMRLHLVHDLQLERATDLLLVDAAVEAFVQARILLSRANPLSPYNGPAPKEEQLFRSQAVRQQKLFMGAMEKLQPKPSRPLGRPPAKKTG